MLISNEKCLPLVGWVEKLHTYLYGPKVIVETDHKPLETILRSHEIVQPPDSSECFLNLPNMT